MKLTLLQQDALEEGREEGLKEGREEGLKEGKEKGEKLTLVKQVCRKITKAKTPETIAEELDEDLEKVTHIYDVALRHAPDYDPERILSELTDL